MRRFAAAPTPPQTAESPVPHKKKPLPVPVRAYQTWLPITSFNEPSLSFYQIPFTVARKRISDVARPRPQAARTRPAAVCVLATLVKNAMYIREQGLVRLRLRLCKTSIDGGASSHRCSWNKKAKIFPHQNFCLFAKEQACRFLGEIGLYDT